MSSVHRDPEDRLWMPDHPDGSGWADVDWSSVVRGSRYHYRHGESLADAERIRPDYYRIVTRLESDRISPHENSYFVSGWQLADFLAELLFSRGAEILWHVEPCPHPPAESRLEVQAEPR